MRLKSLWQTAVTPSLRCVVGGHMSQRQNPCLMCCVETWRFHSFLDTKCEAQPYEAKGQGKGRQSSVEVLALQADFEALHNARRRDCLVGMEALEVEESSRQRVRHLFLQLEVVLDTDERFRLLVRRGIG